MAAEHKCPVTTFPAFCYQVRCESDPCVESIEQNLRYDKRFDVRTHTASFRTILRNYKRS